MGMRLLVLDVVAVETCRLNLPLRPSEYEIVGEAKSGHEYQ